MRVLSNIESVFDIEKVNQGLEVAYRQDLMQNFEGELIDVKGRFIRLGYDKYSNDNIHALIQVLAINGEEVYIDVHFWIKNVGRGNQNAWKYLRKDEVVELSGEVYSYKADDVKYSIYLESSYSPRIGRLNS